MAYDTIVIGGSYAGLSAAMQLARARRRVLVIDAGRPRNRFAAAAHGFLGQDGKPPLAILQEAVRQLSAYPTVAFIQGEALTARRTENGFSIALADGREERATRLVLATGLVDELPPVPGLQERWGATVLHCPYCHGYEVGDRALGVLANHPMSAHQAALLPDWGPTTYFHPRHVRARCRAGGAPGLPRGEGRADPSGRTARPGARARSRAVGRRPHRAGRGDVHGQSNGQPAGGAGLALTARWARMRYAAGDAAAQRHPPWPACTSLAARPDRTLCREVSWPGCVAAFGIAPASGHRCGARCRAARRAAAGRCSGPSPAPRRRVRGSKGRPRPRRWSDRSPSRRGYAGTPHRRRRASQRSGRPRPVEREAVVGVVHGGAAVELQGSLAGPGERRPSTMLSAVALGMWVWKAARARGSFREAGHG
jgi:choline dehydrogenase-like flavoprotein